MYRLIFLFATGLLPSMAHAQNLASHNFTWKSDQRQDLVYDTLVQRNSTFVSYGKEKFEMVQSRVVLPFIVVASQGEWADVSAEGQLIFQITLNGQPGIITVGKNSAGTYLVLDMTPSSAEGIRQKFIISSLTTNE